MNESIFHNMLLRLFILAFIQSALGWRTGIRVLKSSVRNNNPGRYPESFGQSTQETGVQHKYDALPQYISYGSEHYPVYRGDLPEYVNEYRNSGSRFNNLLTGLALYNLGRMSAHEDSYRQNGYSDENPGKPGDACSFVIYWKDRRQEYVEVKCRVISSFIWDDDKWQTVGNSDVGDDDDDDMEPEIEKQGIYCAIMRENNKVRFLKTVDCALLQAYAEQSYSSCHRVEFATAHILLSCLVLLLFK